MKNIKTLTSKEYWAEEWGTNAPQNITFEPDTPFFCDIHRLFKKHLPKNPELRCLEVGCYPGTYMWYFNKYFDYKVSGIEYVDSCIGPCEENMKSLGVDATVIHADLFAYEHKAAEELWDVVTSFGFIEHFDDTKTVIDKHLDLLKPGGHLALVIPNHAGLGGKILKFIDKEKYVVHNLMSYERMEKALLDTGRAEIIEGGYYGRIGFWNTALYSKMMEKGRLAYVLVRAPLYIVEHIGRYIMPNTKFFSPNSVLVAKKL